MLAKVIDGTELAMTAASEVAVSPVWDDVKVTVHVWSRAVAVAGTVVSPSASEKRLPSCSQVITQFTQEKRASWGGSAVTVSASTVVGFGGSMETSGGGSASPPGGSVGQPVTATARAETRRMRTRMGER